MRIEAPPQPSTENVPAAFAALITRIHTAPSDTKFVEELDRARCQQAIQTKTELCRWAGVLDRCDQILEEATVVENGSMKVDADPEAKKKVVSILKFTALLFECTSTRRVYSSMDRLLALLDASDLSIVADVLRLLQTIGKRSKFLPTRLSPQEQSLLVEKLTAIAQCWGGKLRSLKMVDTINETTESPAVFPFQYSDGKGHEVNVEQRLEESEPLLTVVDRLTEEMEPVHRYAILARLRMIRFLDKPEHRMHCLVTRLLSISTLIYCRCHTDENQINALVFPGFVDETAALLKVPLAKHYLVDQIQAEALRTLTAIVSLDKVQKVTEILEGLGANSYHGFLANFTRMIVGEIKAGCLGKSGKPSIPLATALFSFIYHVSNNETGGEKLMSCGLMQTLVSVIEHKDICLDLLSFATRCSRIIDTMTQLDITGFRNMKGLTAFLDRIEHEINECKKEQPFVIDTSEDTEENQGKYLVVRTSLVDKRCHQLRVGLIKGLLTFVKRIVSVSEMADAVRHMMDGNFPESLIHIISNAEYYSDSIYHHTLQLLTNFIYQEPAQLTLLQTKHVPYVMLQSMLRKELPNSREVISSLGNVFTALCLNENGLNQFKSYKPFEHVFKILLSIKYLATIKKRRPEMADSAANIGASFDDLLRHHPTLKPLMLVAVQGALDTLKNIEPPPNTKIVMAISKIASRAANMNVVVDSPRVERPEDVIMDGQYGYSPRDDESDDDEDETDLSMDDGQSSNQGKEDKMGLEMDCPSDAQDGSRIIPLGDYIVIFTKVFEQIITQTNANELVEGFVSMGGAEKLIELSQIPSIATELNANTTFAMSLGNIMGFLLSKPVAGSQMMGAIMKVFDERAAQLLLDKGEEQIDGSYLLQVGKDSLKEGVQCLQNVMPLLIQLSKQTTGPTQYLVERKGKVHDAWLTPVGKEFHQKLRRAARYLSWESVIIREAQPDLVKTPEFKDKTDEAEKERKTMREKAFSLAGVSQETLGKWKEDCDVGKSIVGSTRQLNEFLNLLARSCYNPVRRGRRYEYSSYTQPKCAQQLAEEIFRGIYQELKYQPKERADSPMEFGRLSDVLVQLTNCVLFDDRKMAYHSQLDKFYSTGLHKAFCDVMTERLAPALEGPPSIFLDAAFNDWFRLADCLANRQRIVNSLYKPFPSSFDPEKYMRLVQSDLFRALSELFSRLSRPSVNLKIYQGLCEEAINVFKEVSAGKIKADQQGEVRPLIGAAVQEQPAAPNEDHVHFLMEMGYGRDQIIVALARSANPEEAAEYLIANGNQMVAEQAVMRVMAGGRGQDDDDEPPGVDSPEGEQQVTDEQLVQEANRSEAAVPLIVPLKELTIDKDFIGSISQACIELMPLCKRLMEVGSDLVYSCADLIISVEGTLDSNYKMNELLKNILGAEIAFMAEKVIHDANPQEKDVLSLSTRVHFACLLFENTAVDYLKIATEIDLPRLMQQLLTVVENHFEKIQMTEKLLPPVILWLDLYDKFTRLFQRRELLLKAFGDKEPKALKWSWLGDSDDRYRSTKKWTVYSAGIQEIINKAFFEGRSKVQFKKGEKDTTIDFGFMMEKESGMNRLFVNAELPDAKDMPVTMAELLEQERKSIWPDESKLAMIGQITRIMQKGPIYHKAVYSILSFLARLTKNREVAYEFYKIKGIEAMIRMRSVLAPFGTTLVSITIRQCIENDELYRSMFEKTIRQTTACSTNPIEFLGITDHRPKEWHETLNKLAPLAVLQPEIFTDVMARTVIMKPTGNNGTDIQIQYNYKAAKFDPKSNQGATPTISEVINFLVTEVLNGDFENAKEAAEALLDGKSGKDLRMLSRASLLNILSEIIKSYQCAAGLFTESKQANTNQKILVSLVEKFLAHEEKDTMIALKTLIAVLASCNHTPKAQESLVSDIRTCLANICENPTAEIAILHRKLTEMCSIIVAMAEHPSSHHTRAGAAQVPGQNVNPILKLFHKKKICNDLVKTITLLRFNQKESMDTVAEILRTMEVLMRNMNPGTQITNIEELMGGQSRGVRHAGLLSLEEIFQSHLENEGSLRRRMDLLDRAAFLGGEGRLENLREQVEQMERRLQELNAAENGVRIEADIAVNQVDEEPVRVISPHRPDEEMDNESQSDEEGSGEDEEDDEDDDEGEDGEVEPADMHESQVCFDYEWERQDSADEEEDAPMEVHEDNDEIRREDETEDDEEEEGEDDDDDDDDDDEEDDYENDRFDQGRFENIYMDGIGDDMFGGDDEWPNMPPFMAETGYLTGYHRMRGTDHSHGPPGASIRRRNNPETAHPLLARPAHPEPIATIGSIHNPGVGYDYHNIILGVHNGAPFSLTRQNAIRRIGGGTSRTRPVDARRMFFDRLFDARDGHGMMTAVAARDFEQRIRANIPSALDRLQEGADLLDPVSLRYMAVIINAYVTQAARTLLAEQQAAREEEKRKEAEKRAEEAAKQRVDTEVQTEPTGREAGSSIQVQETAVVVAPPQQEVAEAWVDAAAPSAEAMDVTEQDAVHEDPSEAPPNTSSAATVASSIPEDDQSTGDESPIHMDETSAGQAEHTPMDVTEQQQQQQQPEQQQEAPPAVEEQPAPAQEIPEEYRAILGDIVVPEGVDVAFLAALPDDMRAEVLRDHERQQRANRATAAPPPAQQGQAPAGAVVVEPLDQEFLNALPPELQEEILQQHERQVREAEEAIRRANEPAAAQVQPELDGAAVIASLPPRERQQVLAEMDETELSRLPQNMQEEARRARAHMAQAFEPRFGERNVMRIHNLYVRANGGRGAGNGGVAVARGAAGQAAAGTLGVSAGRTHTASSQAVQLLDRESIITLCGLYLIDHRVSSQRLQKVIRLVCSHPASCDFVLWCLLSFLDKTTEGSTLDSDEPAATGPEWLNSISLPAISAGEKCCAIAKNGSKIYVNPSIAPSICRNVVDTMHSLSRVYPGHFLPVALRTEQSLDSKLWPDKQTFWMLLQNPTGKGLGKEPVDLRPASDQFAASPFTHFFQYFKKKLIKENGGLQDKLLRVVNTIAQTLPDDSSHRLGVEGAVMEEEVKILIDLLSFGRCGPDGYSDGRSTLLELMRVLPPTISDIIYDKLSDTITKIGLTLQPQIEQLLQEMKAIEDNNSTDGASTSTAPLEKGRVVSARLAGDSVVVDGDSVGKTSKANTYACAELRLPAMTSLTDKHGAQYRLLSTLQSLTKLRDTMRQRKQKRLDEEKKKVEAAAKEKAEREAAAQQPAGGEQPPVEEALPPAQEQVQADQDGAEPSTSAKKPERKEAMNLELLNVELAETRLSVQLRKLEDLWSCISAALVRLGRANDPHAVLALQPAAEAFFLAHAVPKASALDQEHPDNMKMIEFAEMHREVLNQVLRQSSQALSQGGPFAFLTQFPKLLDFDVKRKFFRKELGRLDNDREFRRADINVQVRRTHLFSDSYRDLYRLRPAEWKKRFYIVFQGEEGQDAGGLLREWFSVITREIFNPNYALFITAPGDMVTYMINKASYINPEHLDYFKFVGRLIAKAIYDNKLLDCYFTRAFYKHILNVPVRYQDIESEDPAFFKSLEFLLENPINDLGLDLTFSLEVEEFGVRSIRDLKENGRKIDVTDENKHEYVNLVCQMKMTGSIQKQLDAFLSGFYEIIPKPLISMFNEQELELLISGLPDVDIDDLANNTEYKSYTKTSPQIQWFWRALRSFEPEDRAKFLQFVTGTSKVPLQGFASLEGMNGVQKFSIHSDTRGIDRLPAAHTCFNQLDLPEYESYEKLRDFLLMAVRECTEGFGFA